MRFGNLSTLTPHIRGLIGKPLGYKIKYFWNFGWQEGPEIMIATALGIIGTATFIYCGMKRNDGRPPRYFRDIVIYRPDDPRVKSIRTDDTLRLQRFQGTY